MSDAHPFGAHVEGCRRKKLHDVGRCGEPDEPDEPNDPSTYADDGVDLIAATGGALTDAEVEALVEALRYDRCEYGCAITYTTEAVKYDLAPAIARIVAARTSAAVAQERELIALRLELVAEENYEGGNDVDAETYRAAARIARGGAS